MKSFVLVTFLPFLFISALFTVNDTTANPANLKTLITESDISEKQPPTFSVKPVELSLDTLRHLKIAVQTATRREKKPPRGFTLGLEMFDTKCTEIETLMKEDTVNAEKVRTLFSLYLPVIKYNLDQANQSGGLGVETAVKIHFTCEQLSSAIDQTTFEQDYGATRKLLRDFITIIRVDLLNCALIPLKLIKMGPDGEPIITTSGIIPKMISKLMLMWERFHEDPVAMLKRFVTVSFASFGAYFTWRTFFSDKKNNWKKFWNQFFTDLKTGKNFLRHPITTTRRFWYDNLDLEKEVNIPFDEIPGYADLKKKLEKHYEAARDGYRTKPILLYGRPGLGKTQLILALALKRNEHTLRRNMSEFSSAGAIKWDLIHYLKKVQKSILILDEADKIAKKQIEDRLLTLINGQDVSSETIVFIIANSEKKLSVPFYDRCHVIKVEAPTQDDARAILEHHLKKEIDDLKKKGKTKISTDENSFNNDFYNEYSKKIANNLMTPRDIERLVEFARNNVREKAYEAVFNGESVDNIKFSRADFDAVFDSVLQHSKKVQENGEDDRGQGWDENTTLKEFFSKFNNDDRYEEMKQQLLKVLREEIKKEAV